MLQNIGVASTALMLASKWPHRGSERPPRQRGGCQCI